MCTYHEQLEADMIAAEAKDDFALSDQRWKCKDTGEVSTGKFLHEFISSLTDTDYSNGLLEKIVESDVGNSINIELPETNPVHIQRVR
jgi:hypothetical protein